ncbi:MAG: Endonuclease III [Myxococcota bacterium]|nr:Endonuclease III [Myxococcota bacterium]
MNFDFTAGGTGAWEGAGFSPPARWKTGSARGERLLELYFRLRARFGRRGWWPAETPFEVCVGAILTQNTAWSNVEKAIAAMRGRGWMDFPGLAPVSAAALAPVIRSSGYYNQKALKLRRFVDFIERELDGDLMALFAWPLEDARRALLALHGVGPETADSMLCYAGGLPIFVVDAYTSRIFSRMGLARGDAARAYAPLQAGVMDHLPADAALYNDFHAQLVELGARHCRPRNPLCETCPARPLCATGRLRGAHPVRSGKIRALPAPVRQ